MTSRPPAEEFVALLAKHQHRVFAFILTLVPDWTAAEELLQETNIVLWRKFDEFATGTDFAKWACQVAYFEVQKHRRGMHRDRLLFSNEIVEAIQADALASEGRLEAQRLALAACREKLSFRDRDLLDRRYQPNATTAQVAAEVGRSADAVYKALQRIRDALLTCIRRRLAREERQ